MGNLLVLGCLIVALIAASVWYWLVVPSTRFPQGTSVLLITIDTLRPDALGFVAGRNETPNIDSLAATGVRFDGAISQVPLTLPSHTTIMTGLYPVRHGIHINGQQLADQVPTLAEQFRAQGYATAAFPSATVLKKEFGLDRGFDVYDDSGEMPDRLLQRRASQTFAAASAWIAEHPDKPWFVWVHVYDAHRPYDPPRVFWKPGVRGNYEGAVTYIDNALPVLLDQARAAAPEKLLTVLTADHGEAFGEHGEFEHGIFIYDTTTRVPLIFNYPGVLKASEPDFVPRLVDLAPTLLGGFGWSAPIKMDGVDLSPGLLGAEMDVPAGYVESEFPWTSYAWAPLHALHSKGWKLIDAPAPELYHLAVDAGESSDLIAENPTMAATMTAQLDRIRLEEPIASAERVDDAATLSKLQSLGYVGAGSMTGPAPEGRPDPKDFTKILVLVREAENVVRNGDIQRGFELFDEILEQDPENRYALSRSGTLALELNNLPVAIERLQAALKNFPDQSDAQFALADALTRAKRYREAIPHWMETVKLQPKSLQAWSNLGSAAIWAGDLKRAIAAYSEALRLEPNDPSAHGNLGEAQRLSGNREEAVKHLILAAEGEGEYTSRSSRIGLLLSELGRNEEALAWLAGARESDDDYTPGQVRRIRLILEKDVAAARELTTTLCSRSEGLFSSIGAEPDLAPIADACTNPATSHQVARKPEKIDH